MILDLTLALTPRVGAHIAADLIDKLGSVEAIFALSEYELKFKTGISASLAHDIATQVARGEAEREVEHCRRHGIEIIAATDPRYPALLKLTNDYPHILYVLGRSELLNRRLISIVGTRKISSYGERSCNMIVEQLAARVPDLVVVSGLAYGVDAAAHRASLFSGTPTVAILPSALPTITPAPHSQLGAEILKRGGALVSEQRSTLKNAGRTFISRNRLIAGISAATIIVESTEAGGSMSTANIASKIGRPLAAVPGRITDAMSEGCNKLISDGRATMLTSGDDIVRLLGWEGLRGGGSCDLGSNPNLESNSNLGSNPNLDLHLNPSSTPSSTPSSSSTPNSSSNPVSNLSEVERGVLLCFREEEPLNIETLEELTQLSTGELLCTLIGLEMAGALKALPGSLYERIIPYRDIK